MAEAGTEKDVQEELDSLKEKFGKDCRILNITGEYKYTITIRPDGNNITFKFLLQDQYPSVAPEIVVRSEDADSSQMLQDLTIHLNTIWNQMQSSATISKIVDVAFNWLDEHGIDITKTEKGSSKTTAKEKRPAKQIKVRQEIDANEKLPSMKTASDVISRIIWDSMLAQDQFIVGYIDRFTGLVESNFETLSWEDIASVDNNTLVIPKHRIQFFKYKGVKVWDKIDRLDNVFGSTGSGMTIADVIASIDSECKTESLPVAEVVDSEEKSDDDICVITEPTNLAIHDAYWGDKVRPTHFLCLRINNPETASAVREAHKKIVEIEPLYEEGLIPTVCLHITIACLGLDTEETKDNAIKFVEGLKTKLKPQKPENVSLTFHGVDNFYNSVLFASLTESSSHQVFPLVKVIRDMIEKAGIEIRDVFDFNPHMTLLKLKPFLRQKLNTRYLDGRLYQALKDVAFGTQLFDNLYLCAMSDDRQTDGFYISLSQVSFS